MTMRIGGLASGMDIDLMVKKFMTTESIPLNKLNQQKQLTEWKRDGYRQVSTKLVSFNEKLTNYSLSSAIDSKKATVTGASNVLTATATGASANSVLNIKVTNLASASNVVSSGGTVGATPGTTKLSDIYTGAETSITIGSDTISFSADDTIDSLVSKINRSTKAGVTAVYDASSGKISLTNKETGNKDITLSGELLEQSFGLKSANVVKGKNAVVEINGLITEQTSNRFTINGVEISLNGTTPTGQSTQIEVSQDVDTLVNTIKSFVEAYNDTLSTLNQKTSEERYRKFLPLTSDQKKDMSDDEVKLWDSKAKSGMLKNDSIVDKTISDMRSAIISDVVLPSGEKVNLAQFGITTGGYSEKGKLYIDEKKLRTALETTPEKVTALFGQTDTSSTKNYTSTDGIFSRLKKTDQVALQSLADKAGTSKISSDLTSAFLPKSEMGDQLSDYDKRIDALQDRLTMVENRYYKQFAAMETAMNKYNSTSSSLSSMFS
ncbi:flagellar cap protein FliD [Paenibacillus jamilae]|uniref:flagellar filament capping protein FliD n=1 Tax=Paenibacillus TaxID=44249 RepID=UPI000E3BC7CC|nr:flagellar filament capping protein FliD [Paenibacillus jamilae]RFT99214.1 flagellar cap protein FliD [Paenibacillus jamilae]